MNEMALSEIERSIGLLSTDEQLLLISRVAEKLRAKTPKDSGFENELAEMADDADIQRELKEIEADFRSTEFDGLAK